MNPKDSGDDKYGPFKARGAALAGLYGYDADEKADKGKKMVDEKDEQIEVEKVDFEKEVEAYLSEQKLPQNCKDFIRKITNAYEKGGAYANLNLMNRTLLDHEDTEFKSLPLAY